MKKQSGEFIWLFFLKHLSGKLIAIVVNYFFPDGLPFIDEIIQVIGIIKHFKNEQETWNIFWSFVLRKKLYFLL